jgi:hypothetical protein
MEANCYCSSCNKPFLLKRNKAQRYCSDPPCQKARKNTWRTQKRLTDPDYRENQKRANKTWHQKSPNYWQDYRATHSEYTYRDRERARVRKQRKSRVPTLQKKPSQFAKSEASQFAKSDALTVENSIKTGTYRIVPVMLPGFAKSDALMVEISLIT